MNYLTHQLLNAKEINVIKKELEETNQDWEDGKNTAGSHASKVKNNLQLKRQSDISKKLSLLVKKKLLSNDLIKMEMLVLSKKVFLDFALFQISIYGYFIPIKSVQTLKAIFDTQGCIIFYIANELFDSSVTKR